MSKKQLIIETSSVVISILFIAAAFILDYFIDATPWYVIMLFGLSFAIGGYAKAKEGILATIENKSLNVEILMILAALGAFFSGNYSEGAILILIFSIINQSWFSNFTLPDSITFMPLALGLYAFSYIHAFSR